MSAEINTRNDIKRIFSTFPDGNINESLAKSELLSGSENLMIVQGGDTECVPLDYISFKTYVCKSDSDKAPQGVNGIAKYSMRIESLNTMYIYFTNSVGKINLGNTLIGGTTEMPWTLLSVNPGETSQSFGIDFTHEGNRAKIQVQEGAEIAEAFENIFSWEMSTSEFSIRIQLDAVDLSVTYVYHWSVTPNDLSFPAEGGSVTLNIDSYKTRYINGASTGEVTQVSYRPTILPTGFSMQGKTIVASPNTSSSPRTGNWRLEQFESGREALGTVVQAAAAPVTNYNIFCSPNYLNWGKSEVINRDITVTSEKVTLQGGSVISREDIPFTYELTGRDAIKFSAWTLNTKTIRVSPRGLNNNNQSYEAILVLNQTGTSERYSANLIQLA